MEDFGFRIEIDGLADEIKNVEQLKDGLKSLGIENARIAELNNDNQEQYKQLDKVVKDYIRTKARHNAQQTDTYKEQQKINEAIKANNRTVRQQVRIENAAVGSYDEKAATLTKLRQEIRSLSEAELYNEQVGGKLFKQINELDKELKGFDESVGQHFRHVGNYEEKIGVPLRRQLLTVRREMQQMAEQGKTNEQGFKDLEKEAGRLTVAIDEAAAAIKRGSQANQGLYDAINIGESLASVYGIANGAMALFGGQSEEVEKSIQKLVAVMTLLQTAQRLQNNLTTKGTATQKAYKKITDFITGAKLKEAAATTAQATAQKASTASVLMGSRAFRILRGAIISTGIGALIVLIGTLISNFDQVKDTLTDIFPELDTFAKHWDKIKAVLMGFGRAAIKFVVAPLRAVAYALKGEFREAANVFVDGINVIQNGIDGYNKSVESSAKERKAIRDKELRESQAAKAKELKYEIDKLEAIEGENVKHTKKWVDMYRAYYKARLASFEKHSDEYKAANLELMRFERSLTEQSTGGKTDTKIKDDTAQRLESFKREYEKLTDSIESMADNNRRASIEREKDEIKTIEDVKNAYANELNFKEELNKRELTAANEKYAALIKQAKELGQDTSDIEKEYSIFLMELRIKQTNDILKIESDRNKKEIQLVIEKSNKVIDVETNLMRERFENIKGLGEKYKDTSGLYGLPSVSDMQAYYQTNIAQLQDYLSNLKGSTDSIISAIEKQMELYPKDSDEYAALNRRKKDVLDDYAAKVNQTNESIKTQNERSLNAANDYFEKLHGIVKSWVDTIQPFVSGVFDIMGSLIDDSIEKANEQLEAVTQAHEDIKEKLQESNSEISQLQEKARSGASGRDQVYKEEIANKMRYNQELKSQEDNIRREKEKAEQKVAKEEKKRRKLDAMESLSESFINTALGVTKALTLKFPMNFIVASLVGAMGAAQSGVIAARMAKFEHGGIIDGKPHSRGGEKYYSASGRGVEIEGGEFVVNKDATSANVEVLDYINAQGRHVSINELNRKFGGGVGAIDSGMQPVDVDSVDSTDDSQAELLEAIGGLSFQVAVTDINRVSDNLAKVKDIAGV